MSFESIPVVGGAPKKEAPKHVQEGLMEAGAVSIQDQPAVHQTRPEKKSAGPVPSIDALSEHFFPKGVEENLNRRAAFESLIGENKIGAEEIGALMRSSAGPEEAIRKAFNEAVDDYLGAWRSTASDKEKQLKEARKKFAESVRMGLH